jgi:hypothetical protein
MGPGVRRDDIDLSEFIGVVEAICVDTILLSDVAIWNYSGEVPSYR